MKYDAGCSASTVTFCNVDKTYSKDAASVQWVFLIRTQLSEQQGLDSLLIFGRNRPECWDPSHTQCLRWLREKNLSFEETLFKLKNIQTLL